MRFEAVVMLCLISIAGVAGRDQRAVKMLEKNLGLMILQVGC